MLFVLGLLFPHYAHYYEFHIKNKSVNVVYSAWDDLPDMKVWKLGVQAKFSTLFFCKQRKTNKTDQIKMKQHKLYKCSR